MIATISSSQSLSGVGPDSDSADSRSTATTNTSSTQSAALSLLDKLRARVNSGSCKVEFGTNSQA